MTSEEIEEKIKELNKEQTIFRKIDKIREINNPEFTRECVIRRKELGLLLDYILPDLLSGGQDIVEFILSINDNKFTKECLLTGGNIGFYHHYDKLELLMNIDDMEFVKECIFKWRTGIGLDFEDILKLIKHINDPDFTLECIERRKELGLLPQNISKLLYDADDTYITKKCIERAVELELSSFNIANLVCRTHAIEFAKECIQKREELGLSFTNIATIIDGMHNTEFVQECITRGTELGIKESEIKMMKIYAEDGYLESIILSSTRVIKLPTDMKIGMEIESIGEHKEVLKETVRRKMPDWKSKEDRSVKGDTGKGIEIVSPILTGETEYTTESIKKMCTLLAAFEQYTNDTCGGHIHIDAGYLSDTKSWQNLLELWSNSEEILYIIANEKGSIPREGITAHAQPISGELEKALSLGSINLESEIKLEKFQEKLAKWQESRKRGINFKNLIPDVDDVKFGTIEFRMPNGTINADTWIENINLFGGLVKASQDLFLIQSKSEEERTEEEKEKLKCFEDIRDGELSEKEKLESLLKIVIQEEDRDIYRERYKINSELLKLHPEIESKISGKTAKKKVKISTKQIGKAVYSSYGSMNSDLQATQRFIFRDIQSLRNLSGRGD